MNSTGLIILFFSILIILSGIFWFVMVGIEQFKAKQTRVVHNAPRPGDNISRKESRRAVRKVISQRQ